MKASILICILLLISSSTLSAGLDNTQAIEGKVVIAAGSIDKLPCPIWETNSACISWTNNTKKFYGRDICFQTSVSSACSNSCKGMLAVDDKKKLYFYEINFPGDGLTEYEASIVNCK